MLAKNDRQIVSAEEPKEELIKVAEDTGVVTITLNRPERLNALAGYMRRDLAEALEEAGSDPEVRVVVIRGEGRAFCAGGDVYFMAELVERGDTEERGGRDEESDVAHG